MPSSSLPPRCKRTDELVNWRARWMIISATFTDWQILQFLIHFFRDFFRCVAANWLCRTVVHTLHCTKSPARLEWCIHRRHHHACYITRELKYSQDNFHRTMLIEGERGRRSVLSSHPCMKRGRQKNLTWAIKLIKDSGLRLRNSRFCLVNG